MLGWTIDENRQRIVELDEIIIDRRFQVRNRTDAQTVKAYASAMQAGSEFPLLMAVDFRPNLASTLFAA